MGHRRRPVADRLARRHRPPAVRRPAGRGPERGQAHHPARRPRGRPRRLSRRTPDSGPQGSGPRRRGRTPAPQRRPQPGRRGAGHRRSRHFEVLRAWRRDRAAEQHVPPYVIFQDKTLVEIALSEPRNLDALGRI
ncbi:MAG TPA: HRDC domain-containing protein, partial [Brevundimonas sp.]|nr:HRDC domain-containing protein [Brevundimonas sp.]